MRMRGWSGRLVLLAALLLAALPLVAVTASAQSDDTLSSEQNYTRAMHLFHTGAYEEALGLFVREKDDARSRFGLASGEHATALNNLGEVYRQLDELELAEEQFVQALAIEEARLGTDDPWLAKPLNNLALVYRAQGRYQEAERNLKRSLQILEDSLGHRHPDVAGSLNNLARLYETTGHPERAEPLLQRALMIARNTLGDAHPTTQHVRANLDRLHMAAAAASDVASDTTAAATTTGAATPLTLPPPMARPVAAAAVSETTSLESQEAKVTVAEAVAAASAEAELATTEIEVGEMTLPLPKPLPEPSAAPAGVAVGDTADHTLTADELLREPASSNTASPDIAAASPIEDLSEADDAAVAALPVPAARPPGLRWAHLPDGRFAIHLASVRSPISATEEWLRLRDLFDLAPDIDQLEPERIELVEQGVFYRVMAGPFDTRDAAAAACDPLRRKDAYCGVLGQSD